MEQAVCEEVEKRMKSQQAREEIARFQARDFNSLREKQERDRIRKEEAEMRKLTLEQTKEQVLVESDPTRVYQPTTSWRTRVTTPRSAAGDSSGQRSARDAPIINPVLVPHLAVPSWRQGV